MRFPFVENFMKLSKDKSLAVIEALIVVPLVVALLSSALASLPIEPWVQRAVATLVGTALISLYVWRLNR